MTKFMDPSFSTYAPGDQNYRDNWEATFGKKKPAQCTTPSGRTDCHGFYQEVYGICDFCGEAAEEPVPDTEPMPSPPEF